MIQQNESHHFTQNQLYILMISISHSYGNWPKLAKPPYYYTGRFAQILSFLQCGQNTKQFISADSLSWAEQNGTNGFVVACTVVEILSGLLWIIKSNCTKFLMTYEKNSALKHDTIKAILTTFHSRSNAYFSYALMRMCQKPHCSRCVSVCLCMCVCVSVTLITWRMLKTKCWQVHNAIIS